MRAAFTYLSRGPGLGGGGTSMLRQTLRGFPNFAGDLFRGRYRANRSVNPPVALLRLDCLGDMLSDSLQSRERCDEQHL